MLLRLGTSITVKLLMIVLVLMYLGQAQAQTADSNSNSTTINTSDDSADASAENTESTAAATNTATAPATPTVANPALLQQMGGASKLTSILYADLSSNMYEVGSTSNQMSSSVSGTFIYRLENRDQLLFSASGSKDLTGLRESRLLNTFIAYRKNNVIKIGKAVGNLELRYFYIADENQRKALYREGMVRLQSGIFGSISKNWSFFYQPRLTWFQNKFKQTRAGETNPEWNASQLLMLTYSLNDKWSFNLTGLHSKSRTYTGSNSPDTVSVSQEINYQMTPKITLGFGHSNASQLIDAERGPGGNINLYDDNSSTVYSSMTYIF